LPASGTLPNPRGTPNEGRLHDDVGWEVRHFIQKMTAEPARDAAPAEAAAVSECVERSLRVARELLSMDIAWIAQFQNGRQVFRIVEGDGDSFGFHEGDSMPLDRTYCQRLVYGAIPNVIQDTSAERGVRDLDVTVTAGIGSYIGVPIELQDGTVYGTLCAASHRPSELAEREADYLRGVARRVASELEDIGISPAAG
jgi:GAF domain-containing protein